MFIVLQFNISSFKIISLESHTARSVLLLFKVVLELGYCNSIQLVDYSRLNVFESPQMTFLEVNFQSREKEKVKRTRVRPLGNWFTVWLSDIKFLQMILWLSKKQISIFLIFDLLVRAVGVQKKRESFSIDKDTFPS